jgi:multiple sugar transport system substrate-binding protein
MTKGLVFCFLAMIVVLSGCGGTKGTTSSPAASTAATSTAAPADATKAPDAATPAPATPAPAGPVNIIAYAAEPDKTAENENLAARIKRFTAKNPNVTITPKFWKYQNTEVAIRWHPIALKQNLPLGQRKLNYYQERNGLLI